MTTQLPSKERLADLVAFKPSGSNTIQSATREEWQEMARALLEAYEQEPVIFYRERNPYNGMATGWQELTQQEFDFVKDNASENAEFKTLYAQPAPSIPAVPDNCKGQLSGTQCTPKSVSQVSTGTSVGIVSAPTVPECFQRLLHHAQGMSMGIDWNNGTAAGHHREKMLEAVQDCRAAMLNGGKS